MLVDSNVQWSNLNGKPTLCLQHDHYFVGRVPEEERPLGPVAAMHASDGIVSHRWWSLASSTRPRRTSTRRASRTWSGGSANC